jgi:hypothetical protein
MSIQAYKNVQNQTDTGVQLSIRAVRSILLYCQDWTNKALSKEQRLQSVDAGQVLCDTMVVNMIDALPEREQELLLIIFTKTSYDLMCCHTNPHQSLLENERALMKILDVLQNKSK